MWRIESRRIVAGLARHVGDFGLAEDLAQEALADALRPWPTDGVPTNAGAWLTAVAQRAAVDHWRRRERLDDRVVAIAHDLDAEQQATVDAVPWDSETSLDDQLRLILIACYPVVAPQARVALTLRTVGGSTTDEIAAALLVPAATIQQRIVRAKRQLADAHARFEVPERAALGERIGAVLSVISMVFAEGHITSVGEGWMRTDLAKEGLRLGQALATMLPREPEVHGLVARMARFEDTDRHAIVECCDALLEVAPSPVVAVNRAVAVAVASGPAAGLAIVDALAALREAARLARNAQERAVLLAKAASAR